VIVEDKTKKVLKFLLRISITGLLLAVVFGRIDLQQLGGAVKNAKWLFLVIVWALAVVGFWVRSVKMQVILRKQQCEVGIGTVFGASAVTALYSLIMPGLLSTTVKWYILKRSTGKGSNVFSSMVYNQVTEIIVRVLVGLLAIIVTNPAGGSKAPVLCVIIIAVIIIASLLVLNKWTGEKVFIIAGYVLKPFPETIRSTAERLLEQIKVFQTEGWTFHLLIVAITLVDTLFSVLVYIFAAKAAAIGVSPMVFVWQSSVVYVLGRFPISVANLGIREFTLIEFLALYGVAAPAVLLMSMIIFSSNIFIGAIGAGFQIAWLLGKKVTKSSE
jgi:uncharacterized membrane protein YbhN (UPF0104 family)